MPRFEVFNVGALADNPPAPTPAWVAPQLLVRSGKLLLGGETKIGKSFLGMGLAYALATGTPWLGEAAFAATGAKVLYLDKELGSHTLAERFRWFERRADEAARAAVRANYWAGCFPAFRFDDRKAFVEEVVPLVERWQPNVLVVDPTERFCAGNVNDNYDVRRFMEAVDTLLERFREVGLSVVLIHHFKKPDKDLDRLSPYAFAGGAVWVNDADAIVTVARKAKQNRTDAAGEYWDLQVAFTLRHGAPPGEVLVRVRPHAPDGRVVSVAREAAEAAGFRRV